MSLISFLVLVVVCFDLYFTVRMYADFRAKRLEDKSEMVVPRGRDRRVKRKGKAKFDEDAEVAQALAYFRELQEQAEEEIDEKQSLPELSEGDYKKLLAAIAGRAAS